MQKKTSKHDQIVRTLEQRLWDTEKYETIRPFETFETGEIDLVATTYVNGKRRLLLFEVKATNKTSRKEKAIDQLNKAHHALKGSKYDRTYMFYVHGNKVSYHIQRVR